MSPDSSNTLTVDEYLSRLCDYLAKSRVILPFVTPMEGNLKAKRGDRMVPSLILRISMPGKKNEHVEERAVLQALLERLQNPPKQLRAALRKAGCKRVVVQVYGPIKGRAGKGLETWIDTTV